MKKIVSFLLITVIALSCATNPYKKSEKIYDSKLKSLKQTISNKNPQPLPIIPPLEINIDTLYTKQLHTYKDTLFKMGPTPLQNGIKTEWIGTVNFNLRKPNFIIIHHTAQDSLQQTLKTFTKIESQVSSHYLISDDGKRF
jgi:N-acetylmuramoyl-L-alanine amidase